MNELATFPKRPLAPDAGELEALSKISQEAAECRLNVYIVELDLYNRFVQLYSDNHIAESKHRRLFNYFSLIAGTILAACALALGAYGIERGSNILAIAALITPIAGLAGVFFWGYRPKANVTEKHHPPLSK